MVLKVVRVVRVEKVLKDERIGRKHVYSP